MPSEDTTLCIFMGVMGGTTDGSREVGKEGFGVGLGKRKEDRGKEREKGGEGRRDEAKEEGERAEGRGTCLPQA